MSQATSSIILVLVMFGLAVYLAIDPPPGFEENLAYRFSLPFILIATGFGVLENLRTRTHMGQLVGALRSLMGRVGAPADPKVKAEAVEILIHSLRSDTASVRETAARQLKNLTGRDFGESAGEWESWWRENRDSFRKGQA